MPIARRRRGRVVPKAPGAVEIAYRGILRDILSQVHAIIEKELFPVLAILSSTPTPLTAGLRQDAAPNYIRRRLAGIEIRVAEVLDERTFGAKLGSFAARVNRKNAQELHRVIGISHLQIPGMQAAVDAFREKNVSLIKSLVGDELRQITKLLENAETPTLRVEVIRERIQERFSVSKSKADLLARDQVLKLNGQVNQVRQQAAGIFEYVWVTSKDERVREMHKDLDGTIQRWDNPPIVSEDGRQEHPGGDYQCRCTASPVIPGVDDTDTPLPELR